MIEPLPMAPIEAEADTVEALQEELRATRAELAIVQRIAGVGSWSWSVETGDVVWSDQLWRLLGVTPGTMEPTIGALLALVVADERAKLGSMIERAVMNGQPFVADHEILRPEGIRRYVSSRGQPLLDEDGRVVRLVATMQDQTERLSMARELRDARLKAEAATEAKARFLAQMGHEIRNPLNAVLGFARLLAGTSLDESQRRYIRIIEETGSLLLAILNDLLDFSKLEAGRVSIEQIPFRLAPLLDTARATTEALLAERPVTLELELDPDLPEALAGDPTRLRQLLTNLLGNAIKFTPRGRIQLAVELLSRDRALVRLRFSVTDSGIGIPKEQQAQLFQRFAQASDSTTRLFGGTGLGLAICRDLVELMGGRIGVESEPGEGSRFWFELPFKIADVPTEKAPAEQAAVAGRKLHVLVVDDVETNRELAQALLEQAGHRVSTAANGVEALDALQQDLPDLVLMDVHMPRMDGLAATRAIRQLPGAAGRLPIVAMTASVHAEDLDACRVAGMDDHLMKPFVPSALMALVARYAAAGIAGEGPVPADPPAGAALKPPAELLATAQLDALEQRIGREPLRRLFLRMLERVTAEQGAMRVALEAGDAAALHQAAHRLVGLSGSLGAVALADEIRILETAGRTAALDGAASHLDRLAKLHGETAAAFAGAFPPAGAT